MLLTLDSSNLQAQLDLDSSSGGAVSPLLLSEMVKTLEPQLLLTLDASDLRPILTVPF